MEATIATSHYWQEDLVPLNVGPPIIYPDLQKRQVAHAGAFGMTIAFLWCAMTISSFDGSMVVVLSLWMRGHIATRGELCNLWSGIIDITSSKQTHTLVRACLHSHRKQKSNKMSQVRWEHCIIRGLCVDTMKPPADILGLAMIIGCKLGRAIQLPLLL